MKPQDIQERQFMEFLSALVDETMSDEQLKELDALLQNDAELRKRYLHYVDMHEHLSDLVVPAPTEGGWAPVVTLSRPWRIYGLVAFVVLLLSLTMQWVLRQPEPSPPISDPLVQTLSQPYVATLKRSTDCQWAGDTIPEGMRLLPGPLSLHVGQAKIVFDSGAVVLLNGPTEVVIKGTSAMVLKRGEISFQSDDTIEAFDLTTPMAVHVNHGTEYALKVVQGREELHVFDGEVSRLNEQGIGERLHRGQAKAYSQSTIPATHIDLGINQWQQQRLAPIPQAYDLETSLLAYDRFQYADPLVLTSNRALAGGGWKDYWYGYTRDLEGQLIVDMPLIDPTIGIGGDAGFLHVHPGSLMGVYRQLATPIDMNESGVFYISLYFQFNRDTSLKDDLAHTMNAFVVQLHPGYKYDVRDHRIEVGIHVDSDTIFTRYNDVRIDRGSVPLLENEPYLFVGKLVANQIHTDQMFVSVFHAKESLPVYEPDEWGLKGISFNADQEYGRVLVHVNTKSYHHQLDDIRIGKTWASVTVPFK